MSVWSDITEFVLSVILNLYPSVVVVFKSSKRNDFVIGWNLLSSTKNISISSAVKFPANAPESLTKSSGEFLYTCNHAFNSFLVLPSVSYFLTPIPTLPKASILKGVLSWLSAQKNSHKLYPSVDTSLVWTTVNAVFVPVLLISKAEVVSTFVLVTIFDPSEYISTLPKILTVPLDSPIWILEPCIRTFFKISEPIWILLLLLSNKK